MLEFTTQKNRSQGASGDPLLFPKEVLLRLILYIKGKGAVPTSPVARVHNTSGG